MIPDNSLSDSPQTGGFHYPDSLPPRMTRSSLDSSDHGKCLQDDPQDWERGGIGLNDPSQGLLVETWMFRVNGDDIQAGPDPDGPWETLFTLDNVTEISGSFDVNMSPTVAFVRNGVVTLWWYNSTVPGRVFTEFAEAYSPRLTLDDKRPTQNANADILFFYLKAGSLMYRQQRDRYQTERVLVDVPPNTLRLGRVGMNSVNRIQVEFMTAG